MAILTPGESSASPHPITKGQAPDELLGAVEALHVQAVARAVERAGKAEEVGTLPDGDLALDLEGSSTV
jgi:hypothetical protein